MKKKNKEENMNPWPHPKITVRNKKKEKRNN